MTGTVIKGKALREDLNLYDGLTLTGTRADSSGGTYSGLRIDDDVDVLSVYGGGSSYALGSIVSAINALGSANVGLRFSPGTWTITDDLTIASNFTIIAPAGCVFSVSSGKTLTISGALFRYHDTYTGGAGTVTVNGTDVLAATDVYSDYAADTGTADTYVITPSPAVAAYAAGQRFRFKAANTCTGNSTLNVSALGAKTIKKERSTNLESGDITADDIITVHYDGSNFQLAPTINSIKDSIGFSTFGLSVIDDADAAAARVTLDAMENAFTTRGDIVYRGASAEARLAIAGNAGMVLGNDGTDPTWRSQVTRTAFADLTAGGSNNLTDYEIAVPSWATTVFVHFYGISSTSSSEPMLQLKGASSGVVASGYTSLGAVEDGTSNQNPGGIGFAIQLMSAANAFSGHARIDLVDSATQTWLYHSETWIPGAASVPYAANGEIALGEDLSAINLTWFNGTDFFDGSSKASVAYL